MPLGTALAIGSGLLQLYGASQSARASKKGGRLAQAAAYENAAALEALAYQNSGIIGAAAEHNAAGIERVGAANAWAIERAGFRNIGMYAIGLKEDIRRHVRQERMHAGNITAVQASSGWMVERGSPLAFYNAEVSEGIRSRNFLKKKGALTILSMAQETQDKAAVTRLTAAEQASAIRWNGNAQSAMMLNESMFRAMAMRREGDLARSTGSAGATSAWIQGLTGAASTGFNLWATT